MTECYVTSDHRLHGASWWPSPHHSARPVWARPELVVLHCISLPEGTYGTGAPHRLFMGTLDVGEHPSFHDLAGVQVSAHLLVERTGDVHQFVTFDRQAWHAGVSVWRNRPACNAYSIGIEVEGTVDDGFTNAQTESLVDCVRALLQKYPGIGVDALAGHVDIAPDRKQDPGPHFPWRDLMRSLHRGSDLY